MRRRRNENARTRRERNEIYKKTCKPEQESEKKKWKRRKKNCFSKNTQRPAQSLNVKLSLLHKFSPLAKLLRLSRKAGLKEKSREGKKET